MKNERTVIFAIVCCASLVLTGCATRTTKTAAHPHPGQRALVVFKITHQDRAGESGTTIRKTGEIVTIGADGCAVIATAEGDIIRCPEKALHAISPEIAAVLTARKQGAPDCVAAEELERWFPAQTVPFTLRWLPPEDIARVLRESKANP